LRDDDLILTNHRSAAHLIARGAEVGRLFAEVMGKRDGYCGGKSGSLHISAKELGVVLTSRFIHSPGIKVVMPSNAADFHGLLKAAIRDHNPVLFFSDIPLLGVPGEVPQGDHVVALGQAAVLREGDDVTLISYAKTVHHCLDAARDLAAQGIKAEVIDLRTLKPLDEATVLRSVRKTGRAIIVHEAGRICGVGAEIAAMLVEKAFGQLRAPVIRLAGPDAPAPASYPLEQAFPPNAESILQSAARLGRSDRRGAPRSGVAALVLRRGVAARSGGLVGELGLTGNLLVW
jgi:pyruvate/2-oxoglutarate/acetoin dehydrogenase E1 component